MRSPLAILALLAACNDGSGVGPGADDSAGTLDLGIPLEIGEPVACDAPAAKPSWSEVGGLRLLHGAPPDNTAHTAGGSAVVDDLDGDGDYDIAVSFIGDLSIYLRDGDVYAATAADAPTQMAYLSLADIDRDGVAAILAGGAPVFSYRMEDGAPVRERIVEMDPNETGYPAAQELFPSDLDCDGAEDLFALVTDTRPDYLLHNEGDGTFVEVDDGTPFPTEQTGRGFDARWFDFDNDYDLDLYVVNDMGPDYGPNALYMDDHDQLVDVSESCGCNLSVSGMGSDAGDIDNDGDADLYVSMSAGAALLLNLGDGTFADATVASGIPPLEDRDMGWGSILLDYDNDGDLDIFQPRGDLWEDDSNPDRMFDSASQLLVQDGGTFTDRAADYGFDQLGSWRSSVAWDDNGDGVLDLLVTSVVDRPLLFVSDGCTEAGWIEVRGPIGARVEVDVGDTTYTTWVTMQSSTGGGRPAVAHVGLGDAQEVDAVRVTTVDGTRYGAQGPLPARRVLSVPL